MSNVKTPSMSRTQAHALAESAVGAASPELLARGATAQDLAELIGREPVDLSYAMAKYETLRAKGWTCRYEVDCTGRGPAARWWITPAAESRERP